MKRLRMRERRQMTLLIVGIFLVLIVGGIAWTLFRPTEWAVRGVSSLMPEVLFRVDTSERAIALTIDDRARPSRYARTAS